MADNILSERIQKQNKLIERISEYAQYPLTNEEVEKEIAILSEIYSNNFRHDYSDFFKIVEKIYNEDEEGSSDFLQLNLDMIKTAAYKQYAEQVIDENICKAISKLYDHINLEILRFNSNSVIHSKSIKVKEQLTESNELVSEAKRQLEEAKEKISHVQGESIAVISIFAAITLAFMGGLSYISSAIASMANAPFYRVATIILLCGLVVFNSLYVLLNIIVRILDKKIEPESCRKCKENNSDAKCKWGIKKFFKKHPFFVIVNAIFLALMVYPLILCFIHDIPSNSKAIVERVLKSYL
jgi:hypothetical protein